ncbi:uncharacterized protein DDB_G0271670-like [Aphidius gifuensis]|uniref:uncharacterized protein DDB_G0271670-like n=1 Tax=Aphidius gifuensis TaxID=684658 RepID=UPI001CDC2967|nr:uncharacterized protein DDB_G0271670-like [Aphidius gifuensis]
MNISMILRACLFRVFIIGILISVIVCEANNSPPAHSSSISSSSSSSSSSIYFDRQSVTKTTISTSSTSNISGHGSIASGIASGHTKGSSDGHSYELDSSSKSNSGH